MNFARIAAAAVIAWIVSIAIGYVVNTFLFADLFAANRALLRPEAAIMTNLPLGFALMLVGFFAFSYAYAKGYEGGGTVEGIRFGVLVAIMIDCFAIVWQYVMTPLSGALVMATLLDYIVEFSVYGAIVGTVYQPLRRPSAAPVATI